MRYNSKTMYTFKQHTEEAIPFPLPFSQTNLYSKLQESQDFRTERFIVLRDKTIIGFFQVIIFPLIKNKTSIYVPYGPVLQESTPELLLETASFLKKLGKEKEAVFVRTDFSHNSDLALPPAYKPIAGYAYKTAYHQPRGEWLLDISSAPDELLASMHKKTRYNINKSLKQGMETKIYTGADIAPWAGTFIALNDQNTKAHGTTTHPKKYFKSFFELASQDENNFIAITRKDGHVLAINVFIRNENSVFCPFGASNDLGKKLGAYYHIKWSSILHMKEQGVTTFNWGGVSVGMNDEYLAGVTKFKTGFGGSSVTHPPLHDIIISKPWYYLYMLRKFLKK